ncbi:hypothetical protein TWF102_006733 [Orbilia oligospora]|uniref:Uncharacterized protein n=1 Tax=Orbilia oligospora TaxID=2813651 RepID=A0A7C8J5N3_ORBOL|nr:hypothetical protein TWF102_006733 [Orbilia oligospora]
MVTRPTFFYIYMFITRASSILQDAFATPMPVPTGRGIGSITFESGRLTFDNGGSTSTNNGAPSKPPSRYIHTKSTEIKGLDGFGTTGPKEETSLGMTKETLPKVLEAFETYLYEGSQQAMGPYTFLTAGGAFRVLNDLSVTTTDINIWSISTLDSQTANNAGKIFSQTTMGRSCNLNVDFFNSALSSDMAYYDGLKLFEAYAKTPEILPMWKSEKKWLTLYSLPIEWQIQTKLVRMSIWYKAGLTYDEKYLKDLQHVLSLMWKMSGMGKDKMDISGVEGWLLEYQVPGNKFGYAGRLLEAINAEFAKYLKNGGKYIP